MSFTAQWTHITKMKLNFWQQFAINSGLNALVALVATGKLAPEQKVLAGELISKGQEFLATFNK